MNSFGTLKARFKCLQRMDIDIHILKLYVLSLQYITIMIKKKKNPEQNLTLTQDKSQYTD